MDNYAINADGPKTLEIKFFSLFSGSYVNVIDGSVIAVGWCTEL